ncbi:hypothetical protein COJ01_17885 [Priestia megaterium]|uniref:hypothetical protein n=1 Tax=Priestia megaterium TaxID=1404 RepID=UPI000BF93D6E|nr:hypothetical protein [Priestia megaterium]PFK99918.1 hypothetical protein COJ01_17885 [Priestia megaterium]
MSGDTRFIGNNPVFASEYIGTPFRGYHEEVDEIMDYARRDRYKFKTRDLVDAIFYKYHEFVRRNGIYPNKLFVMHNDYMKLVSNTNFYHDYTDTSNIVEKFMDMEIIKTIDSEPYVGFVI